MANGRFEDIREVFAILNANHVNYLVMRNYENMLQPELFVGEHADVDLLCADSQEIVILLMAKTNSTKHPEIGDNIHYYIIVNEQKVSLDLRQVGDGYYCENWENDLLKRKIFHECFYVMDDKDYFYTLAYHAILQKRHFSEEYRLRLSGMAEKNGIKIDSDGESSYLDVVEHYMRQNGYYFTYSQDHMVPNRFNLVSKDLIQRNSKLMWKHKKFDLEVAFIELLVKIKHLIIGR